MTEENFLEHPTWDVFSFGRPPSTIDIMIRAKGLDFTTCFEKAVFYEKEGLSVRTLSYQHLLAAKRSSGRSKDMNYLENLA